MMQKNEFPILINTMEAVFISQFLTTTDLDICWNLYQEHQKAGNFSCDQMFDSMCVFAFLYNTGRIQGIREERSKAKQKKQGKEPA